MNVLSSQSPTVEPMPSCTANGASPRLKLYAPAVMSQFLPQEDWAVYGKVMQAARTCGLRFALGGGFAVSFYTGAWRNTKDLDLYVLPQDREDMIEITRRVGMSDYHTEQPYDRSWIYRATQHRLIVDIIWALANGSGQADEDWLTEGAVADIYGEFIPLVPPEELLWVKLHIVQRERCDWPDLLNILYANGSRLNWQRLLSRLKDDEALLGVLLSLFAWLAPGRAQEIPLWLWKRLNLKKPSKTGHLFEPERIRRLDSRNWFGPAIV